MVRFLGNITRRTVKATVLSVVLAVLCCAPHVVQSHSASMTCATTTIHVRLAPPHTEGSAASAQCTLTHKLQLRGGGRIDAGTAQRLLFEAAAIGNVSAIAKAIGEGADVDAPDPLGGKTLVICCVSKPWLLEACCSQKS